METNGTQPLEEQSPNSLSENTSNFQLGQALFRPFQPNDGAYVGADAGGFQILLDFKEGHESFPTFSLQSLFEGKVEPSTIRDKVVLVGTTAVSVPDNFHTPLTGGGDSEERLVRGVKLQGQIISQLIRAGIDGDRPRETWSVHSEEAWVVLWSLLGGLLWVRIWSAG